jgi:hypothetical protein
MKIKSFLNGRPHPGPLPQERENCWQPLCEADAVKNLVRRSLLFLLPGGEDQGEGERESNFAKHEHA